MTVARHATPRKPSDITVPASHPDGSVTVTTPQGEVVELNETAAALWALCDGRTSVGEIVVAATSLFVGPPESIERDIVGILDQLQRKGLLDG